MLPWVRSMKYHRLTSREELAWRYAPFFLFSLFFTRSCCCEHEDVHGGRCSWGLAALRQISSSMAELQPKQQFSPVLYLVVESIALCVKPSLC
jgi:hypothetical protein